MIRRSLAFSTALIILFATSAFSQSVETYAGEFLQIGIGARTLAMGGAAVAVANDAESGYWNPAALAAVPHVFVQGSYDNRFANSARYLAFAAASPLGASSGIGLTIFNLNVNSIKDTRNAWVDRNMNGVFDDDDFIDYSKVKGANSRNWAAMASYGRVIDSTLSAGVSLKLVSRSLEANRSGFGIGFDAAARYKYDDRLTLGLNAQDVTTTLLNYSGGTKELVAPTFRVGGAYRLDITADSYHHLIPTADLALRFENRRETALFHIGGMSGDLHLGLEYRMGDFFALRAGRNDVHMWSVGGGFRLSKLLVDYTYLNFNNINELGNTHRISLQFLLDQERWRR